MRIHSSEAWIIASTFNLASDTRTLAAMVDDVLDTERRKIADLCKGAGEYNLADMVLQRLHTKTD